MTKKTDNTPTPDVAGLLTASRSAHQHSHVAKRAGNPALAHASMVTAREARHAAHEADPEHADPAWLVDALHPKMPGETERRYHRKRGMTVAEVAREKHNELTAHFESQIARGPSMRIDRPKAKKLSVKAIRELVVVPKGKDGQPAMAVEDTEAYKALMKQHGHERPAHDA